VAAQSDDEAEWSGDAGDGGTVTAPPAGAPWHVVADDTASHAVLGRTTPPAPAPAPTPAAVAPAPPPPEPEPAPRSIAPEGAAATTTADRDGADGESRHHHGHHRHHRHHRHRTTPRPAKLAWWHIGLVILVGVLVTYLVVHLASSQGEPPG
jgi:hypothetical protein